MYIYNNSLHISETSSPCKLTLGHQWVWSVVSNFIFKNVLNQMRRPLCGTLALPDNASLSKRALFMINIVISSSRSPKQPSSGPPKYYTIKQSVHVYFCSSVLQKAHKPLNVATSKLPQLLRCFFLDQNDSFYSYSLSFRSYEYFNFCRQEV